MLPEDPEEPLVQVPSLLWVESFELPGLALGFLEEQLEFLSDGGCPRILLPACLITLDDVGGAGSVAGWQPLT